MTREYLSQELSTNLDDNCLFNSKDRIDCNINKAKLLEIKEYDMALNEPGTVEYEVTVDFDYKVPYLTENGISPRYIVLKKETEKGGWRINSIGTGP